MPGLNLLQNGGGYFFDGFGGGGQPADAAPAHHAFGGVHFGAAVF